MVHNILFKFAVDYNELFGNDYSAAKAAGNELRGLISYFNCAIKNLNLPLMALVDYRGFRLIALSILPVTPETIIYGSCDAGRNIHATNDDFNEEMQRAAKTLNLKAHKVRLGHNDNLHALAAPKAQFNQTESPVVFAKYQAKISSLESSGELGSSTGSVIIHHGDSSPSSSSESGANGVISLRKSQHLYMAPHSDEEEPLSHEEEDDDENIQLLWSPADLEGHLGKDKKFYLLDFSRVLPPETPNKKCVKRESYFAFFRFVSSLDYPF